jgi:predicted transposase/invertase (TIGR01784 family)
LKGFLEAHATEVMNMLLTEWNWDDAKEIWFEEGWDEGRKEGRVQGLVESARKMKAGGVSPEQISAWTGLSPEEIKRL